MTPDKIRDAWNKQADQYNQWAELDWEEMIAWTIKCLSTPPAAQRQWVGLTQQDIDIAFDDTQVELADRWRISEATLERDRSFKKGVRYMKIGGLIRYRFMDVLAYENSRMHETEVQK